MKLKIEKIEDAGVLAKERVVLKALSDGPIGSYLLCKTRKFEDERISSKLADTFWFPDKDVSKGDLIVLYTRAGTSSSKKNETGNSSYFFYWSKTESLWNSPDDAALVIKASEWEFKSTK